MNLRRHHADLPEILDGIRWIATDLAAAAVRARTLAQILERALAHGDGELRSCASANTLSCVCPRYPRAG